MESAGANLFVAFLLLVANGFYVAAEFALVKAKGFRIENLAETRGGAAKITLHMIKHIDGYLANCQLGITMASLGLGWVGEPTVSALQRARLLAAKGNLPMLYSAPSFFNVSSVLPQDATSGCV